MKYSAGDIFRYRPATTWCRHGILIVNEDGRSANDTYWSTPGGEHGWFSAADIARLDQFTYIGNLKDYRRVNEYDYEQYEDGDRFYIPMGSSNERHYVRVAATPKVALQIVQQELIITKAESDIRRAGWRIENAKEEIEKLKAGTL